ncbi:MAG TPA: diguanylate cyclase [Candidatus Sulfotelmatobacter sp.]|nr:diguanylate cyclase [Candidatus Sulfotelmatobacter sp.]
MLSAKLSAERNVLASIETALSTPRRADVVLYEAELTILVVDDSPIYRKLVEQSLSNQRYRLLFARNGGEALDAFAQQHPELVITDWSMPDLSGLELCRRIRQDFREHYAYLILVTSNSNKEQVIEGLSAGADDYVTKPFHPGELVARVGVGSRMIQLHREIETKNRQLEQLALTDPLTGLPNRRAIDLWVDNQLSSAARHEFPVWVVIADLDHFKKVNDTYGHDAGDNVLKAFSALLKANTRRSNICGRLGGEEFLLILSHTNREQTQIALERIRNRLAAEKFRLTNETFSVTASFGVAGFSGAQAVEFADLLAHADAALYSAKANGRNRVEFSGVASSPANSRK